MKKSFVLSLVVISILTFAVAIAATPQVKKNANLWGVQYTPHGLTLRFTVTGFDKRSNLQGSIIVDKQSFPLKCKFDDGKNVKCVVTGMNKYAGLNARVWFSGQVFYAQLPFLSDNN